jgi:hypothetical protein
MGQGGEKKISRQKIEDEVLKEVRSIIHAQQDYSTTCMKWVSLVHGKKITVTTVEPLEGVS